MTWTVYIRMEHKGRWEVFDTRPSKRLAYILAEWVRADGFQARCRKQKSRRAELERCDREIQQIGQKQNDKAWLVAMGVNDWSVEKDLIQRESDHEHAPGSGRSIVIRLPKPSNRKPRFAGQS